MRLWHTKLIHVLPREQLVSQWRECSAIAKALKEKGTPNHILVNFVADYNYKHFVSYAYYIREEMTLRGYRTTNAVWEKIRSLDADCQILPIGEIYPEKMDETYLTICYYNLMEKFLCDGIPETEFLPIFGLFAKEMEEETK